MPPVTRLLRRALSLPPDVVAKKALAIIGDSSRDWLARRRDRRNGTWSSVTPKQLKPLFTSPPQDLLKGGRSVIEGLTAEYLEHRFDLLGSGWVTVKHGMACRGLEGHQYGPADKTTHDGDGSWLTGRLPSGSVPEAARIWSLIQAPYEPIDWHLDFKSGYRWTEATWFRDIRFGHLPGVDIKVPWELARAQHLPLLALCFGLDGGFGARALRCLNEFRSQVLDFIATNPPRFGVNWRVPMDIAIRAANWIATRDLFIGYGATFDCEFDQVFSRALHEHGAHIRSHLEWDQRYRANHYLANIVGLLFIGAALNNTEWFDFAAAELLIEVDFQFLPDGGSFEASTCYHRLSAEMVGYATALLLKTGKPTPDAGRLARIFAFSRLLRKPSGENPQIGDNDSGRLFKFVPAVTLEPAGWQEHSLDHRHLDDVEAGLKGESGTLEAAIVSGLADARWLAVPYVLPDAPATDRPSAVPTPARTITIKVPGASLLQDLRTASWSDFGLYLFRSRRLYLLVRCGPIGVNGRGSHAHNDQLSIELSVDGDDWLADPGSYIYTALPQRRDQYRSVLAHNAPQVGDQEPGRLTLGDFWLGDEAKAECLVFGKASFAGRHYGFGEPVTRHIEIRDDRIILVDSYTQFQDVEVTGRDATRALLQPNIPFSPGYGVIGP